MKKVVRIHYKNRVQRISKWVFTNYTDVCVETSSTSSSFFTFINIIDKMPNWLLKDLNVHVLNGSCARVRACVCVGLFTLFHHAHRFAIPHKYHVKGFQSVSFRVSEQQTSMHCSIFTFYSLASVGNAEKKKEWMESKFSRWWWKMPWDRLTLIFTCASATHERKNIVDRLKMSCRWKLSADFYMRLFFTPLHRFGIKKNNNFHGIDLVLWYSYRIQLPDRENDTIHKLMFTWGKNTLYQWREKNRRSKIYNIY